jgi:hypothetical protein
MSNLSIIFLRTNHRMFSSLSESDSTSDFRRQRLKKQQQQQQQNGKEQEVVSKYQVKMEKLSIEILMNREDHSEEQVPIIVRHCCQAMSHSLDLLKADGIFRESIDTTKLAEWFERYNKVSKGTHTNYLIVDNYKSDFAAIYDDMVNSTGIAIAAILRAYVNNLPEPLLGDEYATVLDICKGKDVLVQIEKFQNIISPLHKGIKNTLMCVFYLLTVVDAEHDKMKSENLARVLAPSMVRKKEATMNDFQDISFIVNGTRLFISHFNEIFAKEDTSVLKTVFCTIFDKRFK